jgi:leader peptidase (prepilin peptidase)/N-methyltransferase
MGACVDGLLPLLLSPFIGSFLGVVVRRLPLGLPITLARSACEGCGRALPPRDLVPLLSFALLRGRCRFCRAGIARFHVWIELAAIAVAAWAALVTPDTASLWVNCTLGWWLLALAWIDWDHLRLPDVLTLPLLVLGLLATWWLTDPDTAANHALAAAAGYLAFRGVALAYRMLRQREGLGQGDAKLLAASGAWVGLAGLPSVVLCAALIAVAATLMQRLFQRQAADTPIPFGPYLALATWLVRLYGTADLV